MVSMSNESNIWTNAIGKHLSHTHTNDELVATSFQAIILMNWDSCADENAFEILIQFQFVHRSLETLWHFKCDRLGVSFLQH